jgi:hypothetical protein
VNVMPPAAWARTHLGERVLRTVGREWHVMDTDTGVVLGRGSVNVAVDVTDEGWWLRMYAVSPMSRLLVDEWDLPAIHVPAGLLTLLDRLSWVD